MFGLHCAAAERIHRGEGCGMGLCSGFIEAWTEAAFSQRIHCGPGLSEAWPGFIEALASHSGFIDAWAGATSRSGFIEALASLRRALDSSQIAS